MDMGPEMRVIEVEQKPPVKTRPTPEPSIAETPLEVVDHESRRPR